MKMSKENRAIFLKTVLLALLFGLVFWVADSIYQMFYFKEDLQYMFFHEPLSFRDSLLFDIPRNSKFFRISFMAASLLAGSLVGLLLVRNQQRNVALQASEKKYRQAITAVNDGIFNFIIPENRTELSPVCYTMLGYEPETFPLSSDVFSNLLHPEDRNRTETIIRRYVKEGEPFSAEFRMRNRDGQWVWVQLRGQTVQWDADKNPVIVAGIIANIDNRVRTQRRLKKYTERLEEAEHIARMGYWELDNRQGSWDWSREIFRILQIKPGAVSTSSKKTPMRYIHQDDLAEVTKAFVASQANQRPFDSTHRLKLKSGEIKYVHVRGHHIFNVHGKPVRSFGTIQDITETRRTEQALYDSERRYRALFENAGEGILLIDKDTEKIKHANRTMCRMLGYSIDEITALTLKDILPDEDYKKHLSWLEVSEGESVLVRDAYCLKKGGSAFPTEINVSALVIDGHKMVVGFFSDLTAGIELENERRMLKFAVDNSGIGIVICDPAGACYYANAAALDKMDYSREEIERMNIWDLDQKFTRQEFDNVWKILKRNKLLRREGVHHNKNGTTYDVEYTIDYLALGSNEYACIYIQDISQRKKFEGELVTAKEKAEHSDRLKTLFLANMSHEIRTPMNGILGFADLLQQPNLAENQRNDYAKIINECGNNLLQLINDILDISKIEAGEVKIVKGEFCVNRMMEELYGMFEPMLFKPDNAITFDLRKSLRDDECVIISDENRLRQILTNLISNALKFTRHGSVEFGYIQKNNELEFFVKDSGIGIPADKLDAIFEPFRQVDESLSKKYRGTGLGLAIVKNYARLLEGDIRVESEEGKGSCFYLSIPFESGGTLFSERSTGISRDKILAYNWSDKQVLIVEDDQINFMLLKTLVEKTGATVIHAETATDAVDKGLHLPDLALVLMDVRLPDFTGWEATRLIKEKRPDLPIIAQTANAMNEDREKSFQVGCDGYIKKPISKEIFYRTLDQFFSVEPS